MLRPAFPLFLVACLEWFAGDDTDLITTYSTGERIRIPVDGTLGATRAVVRAPDGREIAVPVHDDHASFYANEVGIHRLVFSNPEKALAESQLAANIANPEESNIAPKRVLSVGGRTLEPPVPSPIGTRRALWMYFVMLVVLLLAVEWSTYNRRVTV
jgi:hypothetical protein